MVKIRSNELTQPGFLIGVVQDKIAFPNTVEFVKDAGTWKVDHVELKYEVKTDRQQQLSGSNAKLIVEIAERNGITLSVHAPYDEGVNFGDPDPAIQKNTKEHMLACLDFCQKINAKYVTVHGGYFEVPVQPLVRKTLGKGAGRIALRSLVPQKYFEQLKHRVLSALTWFKKEAAKRDLTIAIENLHDFSDFKVRYPVTPADIVECVDYLGKSIMVNFDSGHAHSTNYNITDFVSKIGVHRIIGTHLHDNDKSSDQHLPIYGGTINFSAFFKDYIDNKWEFPLNVEVKNYEDLVHSLETLKQLRANMAVLKGGAKWYL